MTQRSREKRKDAYQDVRVNDLLGTKLTFISSPTSGTVLAE